MDFSINDITSIAVLFSGWISIYAGFRVKISVLEQEVTNLRELVTELRQDIKVLLSNKR